MSDTSHVAFLGDSERTFCLTAPMIVELERLTGSGIGLIFAKFADLAFSHREMVEIIRLGLIGGGTSDREAHDLVEAYVKPRPISEVRPLAWEILRSLWFGPVKVDEPKPTLAPILGDEISDEALAAATGEVGVFDMDKLLAGQPS